MIFLGFCVCEISSAPLSCHFILLPHCHQTVKIHFYFRCISLLHFPSLLAGNWACAIQGLGPIKFVGLFSPKLCKTSSSPIQQSSCKCKEGYAGLFQLPANGVSLCLLPFCAATNLTVCRAVHCSEPVMPGPGF